MGEDKEFKDFTRVKSKCQLLNVGIMIKPKTDPLELKAEQFLSKTWVIIKRETKRLQNWLFFYKKEDKMDGILHMLDVIAIIYIAIRLAEGAWLTMTKKIVLNDVFKKQAKILAYLLISGVLGYVLATYVANDKALTAVFAPVINYAIYFIAEEIKKEGFIKALEKWNY